MKKVDFDLSDLCACYCVHTRGVKIHQSESEIDI